MPFGLRQLLAPLTPERFFVEHWLRASWVGHGPLPRLHELAAHPDLSSPEALLSRVVRLDSEITGWRSDRIPRERSVVAPRAAEAFARGDSLYLTRLDAFVPGLRELAAALERDFGIEEGAVTVEGFLSPAGSGVPAHFDYDDNFNVQIAGRKRWWISRAPELPSPPETYFAGRPPGPHLERQAPGSWPRYMPEGCLEHVAEPGTVIYLPRGTWHRTECDTACVAIAFSCKPERWWRRLLRALAPQLDRDEHLRAFAYGLAQPARWGPSPDPELRDAWARVQEIVAGVSADTMAQTLHAAARHETPTSATPRFRKNAALITRFERHAQGGVLHLPAASRHVEVATALCALVEAVLAGPDEVAPSALSHCGLDHAALAQALGELAALGVLTRA